MVGGSQTVERGTRDASPQGWVHGVSGNPLPPTRPGFLKPLHYLRGLLKQLHHPTPTETAFACQSDQLVLGVGVAKGYRQGVGGVFLGGAW